MHLYMPLQFRCLISYQESSSDSSLCNFEHYHEGLVTQRVALFIMTRDWYPLFSFLIQQERAIRGRSRWR